MNFIKTFLSLCFLWCYNVSFVAFCACTGYPMPYNALQMVSRFSLYPPFMIKFRRRLAWCVILYNCGIYIWG